MFTTLSVTLALLSAQLAVFQATIQAPVVMKMTQEEQAIADEFPDAPIMQNVALCESGVHQFKPNGKVTKNPETPDYGILQINSAHFKEAKVLGYDIFTLKGNLDYARVLYDREGLQPWISSFSCWSQGSTTNDGSGTRHIEIETETSQA